VSRRASARRVAGAVTEVLGTGTYRQAAAQLGRAVAQDAAGNALLVELER
jgi:hypothetical protein